MDIRDPKTTAAPTGCFSCLSGVRCCHTYVGSGDPSSRVRTPQGQLYGGIVLLSVHQIVVALRDFKTAYIWITTPALGEMMRKPKGVAHNGHPHFNFSVFRILPSLRQGAVIRQELDA